MTKSIPEPQTTDGTPASRRRNLALTQKLGDFLRFLDLKWRRTAGGWMDDRLSIDRHTIAAVLLPSMLCALLVLGAPTPARSGIAILTGVLVALVLVVQMRGAFTPVYAERQTQAATSRQAS